MMKPIHKKLITCILAVLFAAASLPSYAETAAADEMSDGGMKFVIMMDISRTMSKSDPDGCARDAIQMFTDMLPAENAGIAVLTYGHDAGSGAYEYAEEYLPVTPENRRYVCLVSEMTPAAEAKETISGTVSGLSWNGEQTPIEAALLAGADLLQKEGTAENKGCIILVTDGDYKSKFITDTKNVTADLSRAAAKIDGNGWTVNCIELDYANNEGSRDAAHQFLTENITDRINGETYQVARAGDIGAAYMDIINSFYGTGEKTTVTAEGGVASKEFVTEPLTTETDITVSAEGLGKVSLFCDGTEVTDVEEGRGNTWSNRKIKLPKPGNWEIRAEAAPGAEVTVNIISFSDVRLESAFDPAGADGETAAPALWKTDPVTATASLKYEEGTVTGENLGDAKAFIVSENSDATVSAKIPMDRDDTTGLFTKKIIAGEPGGAGERLLHIEVEFAGGKMLAGPTAGYAVKNRPAEKKSGAEIDLTGYVGTDAEPIPAAELFTDPDGDPVTVTLKVDVEDQTADDAGLLPAEMFPQAEPGGDGKDLTVHFGRIPGSYTGTLLVFDADTEESKAVKIPVKIEVLNHPMTAGKLRDMDMTADQTKEAVIDLAGLFADEDITPHEITVKPDYDPAVADVTIENGKLLITANSDGTTKVTLTAQDDDGTAVESSFTLKGATDRSIRRQKIAVFIGKTGAALIISTVLILAAILAFIIIRANSKIRGEWKITVKAPGCDPWKVTVDAGADLSSKERKHTDLYKLMGIEDRSASNKTVAWLQDHQNLIKKIKISGMFNSDGCRFTAVSPVTVSVNGANPVTKCKFTSGEAEIIAGRDEEKATIIISI